MNERIQQLALQASTTTTSYYDGRGNVTETYFDKEKFAELIVKECVGILMKPGYAMNHPGELADYNRGWVNGRLLGIEHIEGYFGVEQ
jgi:hypothetical protein